MAAGLYNRLLRLGLSLPLFLVHDLGWLLSAPIAKLQLRTSTHPQLPANEAAQYRALILQLSDSPVVKELAALQLRDNLLSAVLLRLLGELGRRGLHECGPLSSIPLPLEPIHYHLASSTTISGTALKWLHFLISEPQPLHLLTAVELLDVDTLRLLTTRTGASGAVSTSAVQKGEGAVSDHDGLLELPDLLSALEAPDVRDVARFSLDLLPTLLETRRSVGSQRYPVGGLATIERHGSLDALLLSELASDDDLFLARFVENELLYFGRERRSDDQPVVHQILVDATASMRGLRQVFARGLALGLAKKLVLLGGEVELRFFDGRLYEAVPVRENSSAVLPYLLSFRSQRGRNYGRVFRDLVRELQSQRKNSADGRTHLIYLLTHGECHIPLATMQALSGLAWVRGLFLLPSGELALDYLPLLHGYEVVSDDTLRSPTLRRARALGFVADLQSSAPTRANRSRS